MKIIKMSKSELREQIVAAFNQSEFRSLCSDIGVRYDNLPGETLEDHVRELIDYCERRGLTENLVQECAELRPNVSWPIAASRAINSSSKANENTNVSQAIQLQVGITGVEPLAHIRNYVELPHLAEVTQGYPCFQLVARNAGATLVKYIKIHLEFDSFQDDSFRSAATSDIEWLAAPIVEIAEGNPFKRQNNRDFIFNGGYDWVLYPGEDSVFSFFLNTVVNDQPPVAFDYRFRCTLWAEGIIQPVRRDLLVRVIKQKSRILPN